MTTIRLRAPGARPPHAGTTRRGTTRRGTTLVELLMALVILGLVSTALTTAIVRQQRINTRTAAAVDVRNQGRITLSTLAAELRGVSPVGGDVSSAAGDMAATALKVRVTTGNSVICWIDAGNRAHYRIPPSGPLTNGNVLTGFMDSKALPAAGEAVFAYDPTLTSSTPWRQNSLVQAVTPAAPGAGCPAGAGNYLTTAEGNALASYDVWQKDALPATVTVGSPVRFARWERYSFAQDLTGDLRWYLFYQACDDATCNDPPQAVSGPFLPATSDAATTGFRFDYYNSVGGTTADPTQVARIDVTARATTREGVTDGGAGSKRARLVQTDYVSISLRNRY